MTLDQALEVALETLDKRAERVGSDDTYPAEAAAVLRAFMEAGGPQYVRESGWEPPGTARRTADLTEALARLKALEEEVRNHGMESHHAIRPYADSCIGADCGECHAWADEIAAIRKAMGG